MPPDQEVLTEIRIALARLETRFDEHTKSVERKMDDAMVSRAHLEERLAPLTENMNRWKGGIAMLTLAAGSIGALVTTFLKQLFIGPSP